MSGNLYKSCEDEEKSGTLNENTEDTEKSGTIEGGSEDKQNSVAFGFGEDEAQSGAPYRYGEEEVQSGMFDEISEDGNCFGSTSRSSGFDSKMSLDGETEDDEMVGDSIGTQNIVQILERITVGQIYSTKKELQHKLRMITIFQNFDYTTYK